MAEALPGGPLPSMARQYRRHQQLAFAGAASAAKPAIVAITGRCAGSANPASRLTPLPQGSWALADALPGRHLPSMARHYRRHQQLALVEAASAAKPAIVAIAGRCASSANRASRFTPLPQGSRALADALPGRHLPSMARHYPPAWQSAGQAMLSAPPMYGRSASGMVIEPSAFW